MRCSVAPLEHLDGLVLGYSPDVHGHHDIPLRLHEVGEDAVVHLRSQNLQEGHRPVSFADAEGIGNLTLCRSFCFFS